MRETMLMSVITHNLEVSFNLSANDMKTLNDLDLQLLRGSLLLGAKSSQSLMFLELGLVPVSFIIKKKRIMYLFHLLTTDNSTLVSKIFRQQLKSLKRGDWINTVIEDLKDLNLNLSFAQIANMSKNKFKDLVKKSSEKASFQSLIRDKQSKSKGKELSYKCLETQSYFHSENGLDVETMRRIYQIRSREIQVKANFPSLFQDTSCPYKGCQSEDTQSHLFYSSCFTENMQIMHNNREYEDIFGSDIDDQLEVIKMIHYKL